MHRDHTKLLIIPLFTLLIFFGSCSDDGSGFVIPDPVPTAVISLDQPFYAGYKSPAVVSVIDDNSTNETIVLQVISDSDATGIPLTLSNTGTNFIGYLNFTNTVSVSNYSIAIAAGDEIRLLYQEPYPQGNRIQYVQWFDHIGYGIHLGAYAGTIAPSGVYNQGFSEVIFEPGFFGTTYGKSATVSSNIYMGGSAELYYLQYATFYIEQTYPVNLGILSAGDLCLGIAATNNLEIELVSGTGSIGSVIQLSNYISLDNSYHFIRIPISDFKAFDMNFFKKFLIRNPKNSLAYFIFDGAYFEL